MAAVVKICILTALFFPSTRPSLKKWLNLRPLLTLGRFEVESERFPLLFFRQGCLRLYIATSNFARQIRNCAFLNPE